AADTPPFFHNNVAATIEDAVEFYSSPQFQASPSGGFLGGINLSILESGNVAAFLRVINASFNVDISIQRNNAAISLANSAPPRGTTSADFPGGDTTGLRQAVDTELALSNEEAQDAINVLSARNLHTDAVTLLQSAISKNNQAIQTNSSLTRKNLMRGAV